MWTGLALGNLDATPQTGTYALVLASTKAAPVRVGKLGSLQLQPGFYVYVGSAHGPGGLRARLAHHLEPTARPHWHIDYLRAHTNPEEVWYLYARTASGSAGGQTALACCGVRPSR